VQNYDFSLKRQNFYAYFLSLTADYADYTDFYSLSISEICGFIIT